MSGAMWEGGRSVGEVPLLTDDVVQSVSQPSRVGWDLKFVGVSKNQDIKEDEDEVSEGAVKVRWVSENESTVKIADIRVIDRRFKIGGIVAKANDPLGHTGKVLNEETMVDLELPNGEIMRDVSSRRLRRVRAFERGDYVICDEWIGRVEKVYDNVTVLFDDGAKCKVSKADPYYISTSNNVIYSLDCPYFQGQKVCTYSSSILESAAWLKGSWKGSRTEGTVIDVEAGTVVVDWIAAGNAVNGNSQPSAAPNEEVDANELLPLTHFSHTKWELADRSLPPTLIRPSSVVPSEGCLVDENF